MIGDAVAEVEHNAAAARGHHLWDQHALVVEDAVHARRVHVGDDVAALQQRENGAQRRIVLADMDHDREIEGSSRLLRPPQRLEIIDAGDIVRQARLDADDDIAMARDRPLGQADVGAIDVVQLALGRDDTGAGDIHQDASELWRAAVDGCDLIDIVSAARTGVDPTGHAILQAHWRPFLALAGMGVNVDQARSHDLAARIDGLGGVAGYICRDRRNPTVHNRHVAHRVEPHGRIDDAPAFDDQVVARRTGSAHTAEQRGGRGARGDKLASVHHGRSPHVFFSASWFETRSVAKFTRATYTCLRAALLTMRV